MARTSTMLLRLKRLTGRFFTRRCLISIGLLLTIPTWVIYYTIRPNVIPHLSTPLTVADAEQQLFLENRVEQNTTFVSSRQIHIHFYNPPSYLKVNKMFSTCPSNCSLTAGKVPDYYHKDVVVFWGSLLNDDFPVKKRPGQIWVYDEREPMVFYKYADNLHAWNGLFNWTMTYRRDSDILNIYGRFKKGPNQHLRMPNIASKIRPLIDSNNSFRSLENFASTAWFVSHCYSQSKRDVYVKLLNKTHPVDVYGACGTHKCTPKFSSKCHNLLSDHYKYYLSFESSLGKDYITEKSLSIYYNNIDFVPITRGYPDMYPLYLPPGSYIDTSRFQDIDELGQFLNKLSQNPTGYRQYFQWRNYYHADFDRFYGWCELCKRLHMPDVNTKYQRVYRDFYNWKFGSSNLTTIKLPKDIS
ncbi:alpha-(1,3)-fucosyltransferase C-like [Argopecten irradians]|uniref:alpha-(1,3)-fucosyltransferase C-like n=1 Tax=Argopecten irradians TaxID=31199 RepID=UPI00370F8EDE